MPPQPMTRQWSGDRAVLLVHGVGNASPGDYAPLVATLRSALGARADEVAVYELYYDVFNDWAAAKTSLASILTKVRQRHLHGVSSAAHPHDVRRH